MSISYASYVPQAAAPMIAMTPRVAGRDIAAAPSTTSFRILPIDVVNGILVAKAADSTAMPSLSLSHALSEPAAIEEDRREKTRSIFAQLDLGHRSLREQNDIRKRQLHQIAQRQKQAFLEELHKETLQLEQTLDSQYYQAVHELRTDALNWQCAIDQKARELIALHEERQRPSIAWERGNPLESTQTTQTATAYFHAVTDDPSRTVSYGGVSTTCVPMHTGVASTCIPSSTSTSTTCVPMQHVVPVQSVRRQFVPVDPAMAIPTETWVQPERVVGTDLPPLYRRTPQIGSRSVACPPGHGAMMPPAMTHCVGQSIQSMMTFHESRQARPQP